MKIICINNQGVTRELESIEVGKSPNSNRFERMFLFKRYSSEATKTFVEICNVDITDIDNGFETRCLCHSSNNVTLTVKDYDKETGNCVDCVIILPFDVALFLGLDAGVDAIGVVILFKQEDKVNGST